MVHGLVAAVRVLVDMDAISERHGCGESPLVVEEVLEAGDDPVRLVQLVVVVSGWGRAGAAPVSVLRDEAVFGPDKPAGDVGGISGPADVESTVKRTDAGP